MDCLRILLPLVRQAGDRKVYFSVDGPRDNRPDEIIEVEKVRSLCEEFGSCFQQVEYRFIEHNLGCRRGVKSAIDWFFDNETAGIILEDDCIPDLSFFPWVDLMLERYQDNNDVGLITGTNFIESKYKPDLDYFFSSFINIWGWATWRRAWQSYDDSMENLETVSTYQKFKNYFLIPRTAKNNYNSLISFKHNPIDTWDLNWAYTCIVNHWYCITPSRNLVSNIGYVGSHFSGKTEFNDLARTPIPALNLLHPAHVTPIWETEKAIYTRLKALIPLKQRVSDMFRWMSDRLIDFLKFLCRIAGVDYKKFKRTVGKE